MSTEPNAGVSVTLPGVFVSNITIQKLDARVSVMFVTIESVRHYLMETDDGSLEWQLLRRALHEGFFDVLHTLDRAGLLETTSQYPQEMRDARRTTTGGETAQRSEREEEANDVDAHAYSTTVLAELVHVGGLLLRNYLLGKELEENEARRQELLQLGTGMNTSSGEMRP